MNRVKKIDKKLVQNTENVHPKERPSDFEVVKPEKSQRKSRKIVLDAQE